MASLLHGIHPSSSLLSGGHTALLLEIYCEGLLSFCNLDQWPVSFVMCAQLYAVTVFSLPQQSSNPPQFLVIIFLVVFTFLKKAYSLACSSRVNLLIIRWSWRRSLKEERGTSNCHGEVLDLFLCKNISECVSWRHRPVYQAESQKNTLKGEVSVLQVWDPMNLGGSNLCVFGVYLKWMI